MSVKRSWQLLKLKLKTIAEDEFGIEVIDVRIKRIELAQEVRNSVYSRMETERKSIANKFRSEGAEEAEKIQAFADKERTIILAMLIVILKRFVVRVMQYLQVIMLKLIIKMWIFIRSIVHLSLTKSHLVIRVIF